MASGGSGLALLLSRLVLLMLCLVANAGPFEEPA